MKRQLFSILAIVCMASLASVAPAQDPPPARIGFDLALDHRGAVALGGHYVLTPIDPIPMLGIKFPTEAWVLGNVGTGGVRAGGAWVATKRINNQLRGGIGLEGSFDTGGHFHPGLLLTFDLTPKAPSPPGPTTLTILSSMRRSG